MLVSAIVGIVSGGIGILSALYSLGKWLGARVRKRNESTDTLPPAITVVNWITTGLERTVVVPFIVEKTVKIVKEVEKVVVPVFVPNAPPRQPDLPEWLKPSPKRPEIHPGVPTEVRPDKKWRPSWTRPHREPHGPEYTRPSPEYTTRRPEPGWGLDRMHGTPDRGFNVEPPSQSDVGDRFGGSPRGGFNVESGFPFDVGGRGNGLGGGSGPFGGGRSED